MVGGAWSPPLGHGRLGANQALGQEGPDGSDDRQAEGEDHDGKGKGLFAGRELVAEELEVEG